MKETAKGTGYVCEGCGMFITKGKFESIINKIYHSQKAVDRMVNEVEDNLSKLNNL
jgi:hypothetical protein